MTKFLRLSAIFVPAAALMPLKVQKMMGVEHDQRTSK